MLADSAAGLRRHKYAALLALLLVSLAIQSFDARPNAEGMLSDVSRTVLSVAILIVVFGRLRERLWMAPVLIAAVAIGWWHNYSPTGSDLALSLTHHALKSVFLWAAICVILRDLFRRPGNGAESVLGAICGYLIAGDAWGDINAIAYLLTPTCYSVDPSLSALLSNWHGRTAMFAYYGFSQMLTIGYSDVTPLRAPATTLSLLASLFGLFYTAIVVAQFVGMAQSGKRSDDG